MPMVRVLTRMRARLWNGLRRLQTRAMSTPRIIWGVMYYTGEGVPKDIAKAREWFRKAAAQGNADAKANLEGMK